MFCVPNVDHLYECFEYPMLTISMNVLSTQCWPYLWMFWVPNVDLLYECFEYPMLTISMNVLSTLCWPSLWMFWVPNVDHLYECFEYPMLTYEFSILCYPFGFVCFQVCSRSVYILEQLFLYYLLTWHTWFCLTPWHQKTMILSRSTTARFPLSHNTLYESCFDLSATILIGICFAKSNSHQIH